MVTAIALRAGTQLLGPEQGSLRVHTYREGMAQKVGHDLVIEVERWEATVEVEGGAPTRVAFEADPRSLRVVEGLGGVKPLSDKDRQDIQQNMEHKVLRGQPIAFRSDTVAQAGGRLTVTGELTLAGRGRPSSFELELGENGGLTGTLSVVQSEWGIKPYRGLMGALKVRDAVEIVLDVTLPAG